MAADPLLPQLLDEIMAERAEIEWQLSALLAEKPALAAAAEAAKRAYEHANHHFHLVELRTARATRHGADATAAAVARLAERYRRARDEAGAAMTRAKLALENCEYRIGSLRWDIEQLERVINPPDPDAGPRREIIKRPPPPFSAGDFEIIEMPPPAGSAAA
jgi:hypothetical protein